MRPGISLQLSPLLSFDARLFARLDELETEAARNGLVGEE